MTYPPKVRLLGEQDEDSEWIPSAKKEWAPPVKRFKRWERPNKNKFNKTKFKRR